MRYRRVHERLAVAVLGVAIAAVSVVVGGIIATLAVGVGIGMVIAATALTLAGRSGDLVADDD